MICPDNYLLSALPSAEYHRLIHDQQLVPLAAGDVICESGATSEYVYFPTTSVISLMYAMEDGSSPEIGLVGNEGMVDVARFLGGETAQNRAVVTIAGGALKMKSRALQSEFARGGPLQRLLLRYTQALITQITQIAACNGLHTVEKRLCRWLLLCHDRAQSNDLHMTQEFLSRILGSRRESITISMNHLESAGLIGASRGRVTILNRKALEGSACECYPMIRAEVARLCARSLEPAPAVTSVH